MGNKYVNVQPVIWYITSAVTDNMLFIGHFTRYFNIGLLISWMKTHDWDSKNIVTHTNNVDGVLYVYENVEWSVILW